MKRCADATFLIDVMRSHAGAVERLREMQLAGETLRSPAPAVAELLLGAGLRRGKAQTEAISFAEEVETIPVDYAIAAEAAQIGVELHRAGRPMPLIDLLVAGTARSQKLALLTRDRAFTNVQGLVVDSY